MERKESNQAKQNFGLFYYTCVGLCIHVYRYPLLQISLFYLIYDPRVNPAKIQSRATIGPPAKRHSDGASLTDR